jgi:hypothetical protein
MEMLGFVGAFRKSEAVALNAEDVEFCHEGMPITIRRSKTDQQGKGQTPLGNSFNKATCLNQADGYLSHRTRLATPKRVFTSLIAANISGTFSPSFPPDFWGNFTVCSVLNSGGDGSSLPRNCRFVGAFLVLPDRIELSTSPLPRECAD